MIEIIPFCIVTGIVIGAVIVLDIVAIREAKDITFEEDKQ